MKKLFLIVAVLASAFTAIISKGDYLPVNVTVKVVDEENKPVSQADVEIIFSNARPKGPGKGWGADVKYDKRKGFTNADGMFSASGNTNMNIPVGAVKSGFYESGGGISFDEKGKPDRDIVELKLKKIKNPVPMYAKKVNSVWGISKIPVLNQDVGYDLEVGDWVAPHGKGKIADFIFNVEGTYKDWKNNSCNCKMKFTNPEDGIQEYLFDKKGQSSFKWPYDAPLNGYLPVLEKYLKMTDGKMDSNIERNINNKHYIFRVRTKTDEKGNIISAKYGKIEGDVAASSGGSIEFNYYFSPSGDRSLEFDTEKNIFISEGAKKWKKEYNNFTGFAP